MSLDAFIEELENDKKSGFLGYLKAEFKAAVKLTQMAFEHPAQAEIDEIALELVNYSSDPKTQKTALNKMMAYKPTTENTYSIFDVLNISKNDVLKAIKRIEKEAENRPLNAYTLEA